MIGKIRLAAYICPLLPLAFGIISATPAAAACGSGAPSTKDIQCVATMSPGVLLGSFDISWVNPDRAEYYLSDRSTSGVDIYNINSLAYVRTIAGFVGVNAAGSNHSGPNGVVTHGRWLYAGDGNSTLKVADLDSNSNTYLASYSTGGTARLDEMALTTDGRLLLAINDSDNPPYLNLFSANGDDPNNHVAYVRKITVDPSIVPAGLGLGMEQPSWDAKIQRFVVSIPVIANNPSGCTASGTSTNTCDGGLLFVDPTSSTTVYGAFDSTTNTGVVSLHGCGPNGSTIGPHDNVLLGCTPSNNSKDTISLVINATTQNYASVANITGSDEVWYNKGDNRYYLAASNNDQPSGTTNPVLGVVDGTSVLIETLPQGSKSHSVAADSARNLIFVPQEGGLNDEGTVICGSSNGCVAVYKHQIPDDEQQFWNVFSSLDFDQH